jgi:hypothetical protein
VVSESETVKEGMPLRIDSQEFKILSVEQVRIDCGVSRDGSNARNIYLAAKGYS